MPDDLYTVRNSAQQPWDANRDCIGGQTRGVAQDLRLSESLVTKWQEPHGGPMDSGARSPVETVRDMIVSAMRRGTSAEQALAPLHWLANECNAAVIPLPKPMEGQEGLHRTFALQVKEFGDVARVFSEKVADGSVEPADAREFQKETLEMIRSALSMNAKVQEAVR